MKPFEIMGAPSLGAKKRVKKMQQAAEERVSLIDNAGRPTQEPSRRRKKKKNTTKGNTNSAATATDVAATIATMMSPQQLRKAWSVSRLMRYLSLTAVSAMMTFYIMGRQAKSLHWQEFHHLLEPELKKDQSQRCYSERRHGQRERCTCPDPALPLVNMDKEWKKQHARLVNDAKKAPSNLDIVFLGDEVVELWNGTKNLGSTVIPGMREPFEQRFTKAGGGDRALAGLALGSSVDTGPNLLWHIQNGMITNLNPKLWFISIGSNDLFEEKCTDRFVVASILNVIKVIHDIKPESHFIIHGILPRKDNPKSKSQFLKKNWKYAQAINTQVRKFCEHSPRLYYMQAGPLFLEETQTKGRRQIDQKLLEYGRIPTKTGLEVWGDYLVKRIREILNDIEAQKLKGLTEATRRQLRSLPEVNNVSSSLLTIPYEEYRSY